MGLKITECGLDYDIEYGSDNVRNVLLRHIERLQDSINGRILTCAYCGHECPQDTPASGSDVLTEHIKACERHPMRKAEADIALLRSALSGLIGAETEIELLEMKIAVQTIPDPDGNATVAVNAINALLATMKATA